MIKDSIKFLGGERLRWCVLGLTALLILFAQAPRTRLTTDPVLYAAIARTMAESGDYGNLKLGNEPYYNKPPLQFWLAAAAIKIMGPNVMAVTLFSRLFGLGCVLLTAWLGSRLYGPRVGWLAGLMLTTSYIFCRGSSTFRLDSALTFGILLALYGYLSSPRQWAPPLFYLSVGGAVLSKGPPGLLPLMIAPVHAYFSSWPGGRSKMAIRWMAWAPLLVLPALWWVYLFLTGGAYPLTVLFDDLMRSKLGGDSRLHAFWTNYIVLAFLNYYWPWLPFALLGAWIVVSEICRSEIAGEQRASAALLLAWVGIATVSSAFKNAQYPRYVFFALPAVSIIAARGFIRLTGEKCFEWLQGCVAAFAVAAAFIIACFPSMVALSENQQYYAIKELLNQRLAPNIAVPMVKLKRNQARSEPELSVTEKSTAIFFFERPLKLISPDEVRDRSTTERVTLLLKRDDVAVIQKLLPLEILFRGPNHVVAEVPRQR